MLPYYVAVQISDVFDFVASLHQAVSVAGNFAAVAVVICRRKTRQLRDTSVNLKPRKNNTEWTGKMQQFFEPTLQDTYNSCLCGRVV